MKSGSVKRKPQPRIPSSSRPLAHVQIQRAVEQVLADTEFIDMHTHLFPPSFGHLGQSGIDDLLTYHYLEAEFFRSSSLLPEQYFELSKPEKADAIWQTLFVENTPISEATRGVIAVLDAFGLPTQSADLRQARAFFQKQNTTSHIAKTLRMAGVKNVVMTNDPLDSQEHRLWMKGVKSDPRFKAAFRLDRILHDWPEKFRQLAAEGYAVEQQLSQKCMSELRRFLADWHKRMSPVYMAVSLPDTFLFSDKTLCNEILAGVILPACREFDLPLSLMLGVRRQVNPRLGMAGDGAGRADLRSLENLCRSYPDNRFFVSVLSRENQHELCVLARKFSNLMPFGCWWFLNNPSIVEEITRERLEMLGTSFIPQHSDARVLEQLIYKWRNTRATLAKVLTERYRLLTEDGRAVTRVDIQKDVDRMFCANFQKWTGGA